MNHCVDCGLPIPAGQHTCSMCYGDPWHGRNGYYMAELELDSIDWEAYQDGRYNSFGELDTPEPEHESVPLGERPTWFFDELVPF